MDRASILGDAIEYLKELLQRINDLHNELESTPAGSSLTPAGSSLTPASSFHPLTPTPPALPSRIKEELCPSSLPSPNGQPARVMFFVVQCLNFPFFLHVHSNSPCSLVSLSLCVSQNVCLSVCVSVFSVCVSLSVCMSCLV